MPSFPLSRRAFPVPNDENVKPIPVNFAQLPRFAKHHEQHWTLGTTSSGFALHRSLPTAKTFNMCPNAGMSLNVESGDRSVAHPSEVIAEVKYYLASVKCIAMQTVGEPGGAKRVDVKLLYERENGRYASVLPLVYTFASFCGAFIKTIDAGW